LAKAAEQNYAGIIVGPKERHGSRARDRGPSIWFYGQAGLPCNRLGTPGI